MGQNAGAVLEPARVNCRISIVILYNQKIILRKNTDLNIILLLAHLCGLSDKIVTDKELKKKVHLQDMLVALGDGAEGEGAYAAEVDARR